MVIQDKWEVSADRVSIGHQIGKGSFSRVNMGRLEAFTVAVKTLKGKY